MAKKKAGFFDLHVEKIVLGLCAIIAAGAVAFSMGGFRFAVNGKGVGETIKSIGESADQTRSAIQSARVDSKQGAEKQGLDSSMAKLADWYGPAAKGLIRISGIQPEWPRTTPFPPMYLAIAGPSSDEKRQIAKMVAPGPPIVMTGRGILHLPAEKPPLESFSASPIKGEINAVRSYVSVAAQVDLLEQDAHFISEKYPPRSYIEVVKVQLQRKDETDSWRGWEDVDTYLPFKPPIRPTLVQKPDGRITMEGLDSFRSLIDAAGEVIARPILPGDGVTIPPLPYLDEPPTVGQSLSADEAEQLASKRVKRWTDLAKEALSGKRHFKDSPDLDAAYILARAAIASTQASEKSKAAAKQVYDTVVAKLPKAKRTEAEKPPTPPERLMPIVAYDFDAMPGHSYVYRMRYEAYNVFAGNPGELSDPADALELTVISAWSPPSRPVEITSDTYFFLTKADKAKKEVTVTVFKVSRRDTKRQEFKIHVGEEIGKKDKRGARVDFTTGLLCVDLDFDRIFSGQKDVSMVYVDPTDGVLKSSLLSRDKKDKVFTKLSEAKTAAAPTVRP